MVCFVAMGWLISILLVAVAAGVWCTRHMWRGRSARLILWCLFGEFVLVAGVLGFQARKWTYEHTSSLRWTSDIENNLKYGQQALRDGWLNVYGNVLEERKFDRDYYLDYWPLRLLVMRQWASWVQGRYGEGSWWQEGWEFTSPLLLLNVVMELAAAVAIFLLIWMWRRRDAVARGLSAQGDYGFRGVLPGLIGALLAWFSPAAHLSAYGWPTWDIWIVPFYLWAVLLGCVNWWFAAGMVLAVGTMLKGQQLLVVPVFVLWPLFMGKPGAAGRWIAGYGLAFTAIVAPWLLRDEQTRQWIPGARALVIGVLCCCAVMPLVVWILHRNRLWWAKRWLPVRRQLYIAAAAVALALAVCPWRFNSDMTWAKLAFSYGTEKFPALAGDLCDNLTTLLARQYGWSMPQEVVWTWGGSTPARVGGAVRSAQYMAAAAKPGFQVTLKMLLGGIYVVCLALCAIGLARHTRRRDVRFLVAMAAPWVICFAIGIQMQCRYVLYGATVAAVVAGVNAGMGLLEVLLIAIAWKTPLQMMVRHSHNLGNGGFGDYLPPDWAAFAERIYGPLYPGLSWAMLLIAAVFLYVGVTSSRRRGADAGLPLMAARLPELSVAAPTA